MRCSRQCCYRIDNNNLPCYNNKRFGAKFGAFDGLMAVNWLQITAKTASVVPLRSKIALAGRCGQMPDEVAGVDRQIGFAADADRQVADCPAVGQLDASERHRPGMTLGRRRRNDPDPDIAFDKPAHRVKAAQLNAQFEPAADPLSLFGKKAL